jgi:hypothetical protein
LLAEEVLTATTVANRAAIAGRASRDAAQDTPAMDTANPSMTSGNKCGNVKPLAAANALCSWNDQAQPSSHTRPTASSEVRIGNAAVNRRHRWPR